MQPPREKPSPARPSWTTYRQTIGDRSQLFAALAETWAPRNALYPGCYLDLAPSTAIPAVTYVDTDRRAARFFADHELVAAELQGRTRPGIAPEVSFQHADYTHPLDLAESQFDLLISLYAGPLWDQCRRYLTPRGLFLANPSHGDAGLAALDPSLELVAAVHHSDGRYRFDTEALDGYLIPKQPAKADADAIRRTGRGIAYTRAAFAYLFRLT